MKKVIILLIFGFVLSITSCTEETLIDENEQSRAIEKEEIKETDI